MAADYFLEDIVQMLDFMPPPTDRKGRKRGADDDDDDITGDADKEVKGGRGELWGGGGEERRKWSLG